MIPSYFVEIESLPLTTNGKVNRNALPEPEIVIGDDFLAPRNEIEDKLTHIWSEVLGIEAEKIGIRASFFELGGHSLRAINLISKIHKEFEVIIPLMEVFKNQKLEDLALYISSNFNNHNWLGIFCAEKKEFYNTSLIHKRLYFLQELHKSNTNYNEYREFVIDGMDLDIIENIFKQLINRHESLRSSFFYVDGEIVQKIHKELEFKIDIYDDIEFNETDSFIKPFALDIPPLMRVSFIKTKKQSKLLIEMHHIITDGISMAILEREFFELLKGEKLKKLKIQTKDYIEYLSSEKIQLNLKLQEKFWLDLHGSTDKKMQFPYDIECSGKKEISETLFFYIEKNIMENIENSIKINGVNRYFFYFSIYCLMLYKVCNTKNIIVGTIVSGRRHVDLDDVVGMFVNTLALKIDIEPDLQFSKYLKLVANRVAACFDNQLYDFNDLLENLNLKSEKEAGSNPLFDSLFLCYDQDSFNLYTKEDNVISDGNRRKSYKSKGSKFDFVFNILKRKSDVEISISYRTDLFKRETVERMYFNWCDIINIVTEKNDILLSSINTAGNYNKIENVVFNDDNFAF
jgi:acyl carrier protein